MKVHIYERSLHPDAFTAPKKFRHLLPRMHGADRLGRDRQRLRRMATTEQPPRPSDKVEAAPKFRNRLCSRTQGAPVIFPVGTALLEDTQVHGLDHGYYSVGNPVVGNNDVYVLQRADAAETALSEFRRVGQHDDSATAACIILPREFRLVDRRSRDAVLGVDAVHAEEELRADAVVQFDARPPRPAPTATSCAPSRPAARR